tara:strand:- start:88 stop:204 length:117 start_codon:yes stop_codon:yes gene_type:complete
MTYIVFFEYNNYDSEDRMASAVYAGVNAYWILSRIAPH